MTAVRDAAKMKPVRATNPKTNSSMIALIPYPGRTPPADASQRMTSPLTAVRTETIECWRSRVSAPADNRKPARLKTAIARHTGIARSAGIGVPIGMTAAARSHMTAAVAVAMRNPVLLSAPPWRW